METEGVDPAEIAFEKYRKDRGLLSPEEIKQSRKRYGLSQKSFAKLSGNERSDDQSL